MNALIASAIFYLIVIGGCHFGQLAVGRSVRNNELRVFLLELIGGLQLACGLHESAVAIMTYGTLGLWVIIFLQVIVNGMTVMEFAQANPIFAIEQMINGTVAPLTGALRIAGNCVGAYLSFLVAKFIWAVGLSYEHQKLFSGPGCSMHYSWPLIILVCFVGEVVSTAALRVGLSEIQRLRTSKFLATVYSAMVLASIVCIGGFFGVMAFMNPLMAVARASVCSGGNLFDIALVHWVGATVGWLGAEKVRDLAYGVYYNRGGVQVRKKIS